MNDEATEPQDTATALTELSTSMVYLADALTLSVKTSNRTAVRRATWAAVTSGVLAVAVLALVVGLFAVYRSIDENHLTAQTIADCTTPGGVCWQRVQDTNAANRQEIVDQIECDVADQCPPGVHRTHEHPDTAGTTTTVPGNP